MSKHHSIPYMPGLDGLRAIAVIAIIVFHFNPHLLPGGFLGVDTFFIISGYLITTILLHEYRQTGTIHFVQFWLKRIKRLFPAVFFMLLVVFNYCLFFQPQMIEQLKKDMIAAFLYLSNWWYIFDKVDYFKSFDPRPLQHLWSLAIEEQFYIVFPVILFIMLSLRSKKLVLFFFMMTALCSGVWMAILYHPGVSISRLYFGTDTRLQTILLGVMLAFIWPAHRLRKNASISIRIAVSFIGFIAIAMLFISFFIIKENTPFLYQGGFFVLGVITLFIIASVVYPKSWPGQLLSMPFLTTIGKYSYSLYLWHYPVIILMNSYFKRTGVPYYIYGIEAVIMIFFAVISYHFIETPFRREGIGYFKKIKSLPRVLMILVIMGLIGYSAYQFVTFTPPRDEKIHMTSTISEIPYPKQLPDVELNNDSPTVMNRTLAPLFIGDSILVDINDVLKQQFPNATIDGEVGRSIYKAIPLAKQYSSFNQPGRIVVLGIGTNGDFEMTQLNQLLSSFNKAEVYLVTTKVPLSYESHVNQLMKQAASSQKNVHLIDWYSVSKDHPEYFASDGIHLENAGIQAMNHLFGTSIQPTSS